MRTSITLAISLLACASILAQSPSGLVNPGQISKNETYQAIKLQQLQSEPQMPSAKHVLPVGYTPPKPMASTGLTPVQLGRATNIFSIMRTEQNQVYADNSLGIVAFIHRQDVTVFGGGAGESGKYRYDFSINKGASFTNDVGVLNSTYTRPARYPNITGHNPDGNVNPFNSHFIYAGPTLDGSPDWDGHVNGVSNVTTGIVTTTEHYDFLSQSSLLPGGLCPGKPGVYWLVDMEYNTGDSLYLYKGTWDDVNTDISFVRDFAILPNYNTSNVAGTPSYIGGNVAASPDGDDVWIAWLGDLTGGHDSTLNPIFMASSDSGATWGSPMEVDLRTIPGMSDSLTKFWITVDSITVDTNPAGSGNPTTAFDYDLTVDINGNPHMLVVVGNGSTSTSGSPDYSIYSGIEKYIVDVTTDDGGATWDVFWVAPILTFRGEFGTPNPSDGSLISMDNNPQISRDDAGERVFYSWVDSDTCVIGWGESDNIAPNLRISGLQVGSGLMAPWKVVSDGDILHDGLILYPTMAPTTITTDSCNVLPIVFAKMLQNDQLLSTQFYYIGNDCKIENSEYTLASAATPWICSADSNFGTSHIVTAGCLITETVQPASSGTTLYPAYPNPSNGKTTAAFDLVSASNVELYLSNIFGQRVTTLAKGKFTAGSHDVDFDVSNIANGVYFMTMIAGEKTFTGKFVVSK